MTSVGADDVIVGGPQVVVVDEESSSERWGPLCIYVDTDTIIERRFDVIT